MTHTERFRAVMNFQPVDRLPIWEWAMWWDMTIDRWHGEGLPAEIESVFDISQYFGLDPYMQFWFSTTQAGIDAAQHHVEGSVASMDDYVRLRPRLFPDHGAAIGRMAPWAARQARGEAVVWATLEGFFWLPRTLLGVEHHFCAFYEQPELIHAINNDLAEYHLQTLRQMASVCTPVFITLAEDMSYNHGPMISEALFDEFLAPYYRRVIPMLDELGVAAVVDTDGDITAMMPWLGRVGIRGALPLERQAGVDGDRLRSAAPDMLLIGHFDKMVMPRGEQAMREEFERLLPLMRAGGYIPSVDHQTPPGVSLEQYRAYLRLLNEYAILGAASGSS